MNKGEKERIKEGILLETMIALRIDDQEKMRNLIPVLDRIEMFYLARYVLSERYPYKVKLCFK